MNRRVFLALAITLGTSTGCKEQAADTQPADDLAARAGEVSRLVLDLCGDGDDDRLIQKTWDAYERLILASLRDPQTAEGDAAAALARVDVPDHDDSSLWATARRVAADTVILVAGHQCSVWDEGGRFSVFRHASAAGELGGKGIWQLTDQLDYPTWRSLVAASRERALVLIADERSSTQANHSDLYLLDVSGGRIRVLETRKEMLDVEWPDLTNDGPTATFRWRELPQHFGADFQTRDVPRFEANVDLDGDSPLVIVSTTPWIAALERICDRTRGQASDPIAAAVPCDAWIDATRHYSQAGLTEIVLSGAEVGLGCGPRDFAQDHADFVSEQAAIVTLRETHSVWQVVKIRPRHRDCAARGTQLPSPSGALEAGVQVLATLEYPLAFGGGPDRLYWSADPSVEDLVAGPVEQIGMTMGAADLAQADFATAITSDHAYVYRTSYVTGDIHRSDVRGNDRAIIRPEGGVEGLAVDGEDVLWTVPGVVDPETPGQLRRLHDGKVEVVASDLPMPMRVAVQGRSAIVATADGLVRVPLDGGANEPVHEAISPIGVAVHGDTIAWTEATGRVVVVRGSGPARVVSSSGRPTDIVLRDDQVIWLDVGTSEVRTARIDGP